MKKFVKKLSLPEWRQIMKKSFVWALILGAVGLSYGYYLVDKMGEEYKQAQMTVLQDDGLNTQLQAQDEKEPLVIAAASDAEVLSPAAADNQKEESTGSALSAEDEVKAEEVSQGEVKVKSYEAVGAVAEITERPCAAEAIYAYGYGYDPLYNDIRFHNHAFYQAEEDFAVCAVADGVVEKCVQNAEGFEVTLKHEWGLSVYENLAQCTLSVGQQVKSGDKIGESTVLRYSLWQEKK